MPNLVDIFTTYTIALQLCALLRPADFISVTRTCKALTALYRDLRPSLWNVDKRLSRFLDDPKAFRSLMAQHKTLIYGSLALQFFDRCTWSDSDLNVCISRDQAAEAIEEHLCKREGYHLKLSTDGEWYDKEFTERVSCKSFRRSRALAAEYL